MFRCFLISLAASVATVSVASPSIAAPSLEDYGRLPAIEQIDVSPDGKMMAIAGMFSGQRQILVMDQNNKALTLVPLGDSKLSSIEWGSDEALIVSLHETTDLKAALDEPIEIMKTAIVDLKGDNFGKINWVFDNRRDIMDAVFADYGIRNIGGKWYGYFGGLEYSYSRANSVYSLYGSMVNLYQVDLSNGKVKLFERGNRGMAGRGWLIDKDGKTQAKLESFFERGVWNIFNASGKRILEGETKDGGVGIAGFGPSGNTIVLIEQNDAEADGEYKEYSLADGSPVQSEIPDDVYSLVTDPLTSQVIGYRKYQGAMPTYFDKARSEKVENLKKIFASKDTLKFADAANDFSRLVVKTTGAGDSGTWYMLNSALIPTQIGLSYPGVSGTNVAPVKRIDYTAEDGTELDGILTLPPTKQAKNLPVIIFPHGGPQSSDDVTFDWWAQALAIRGYAVFQPNFRGSTNRDYDFIKAGWGEWGQKMQTDLSDGLQHLSDEGIVDPDRACIMGASYGGYAALAGVTIQQGLYRCAVSVAGVSDLHQLLQDEGFQTTTSRRVRRQLRRTIGDISDAKAVSPAYLAERADAPILLIHGTDDTRVEMDQSDRMASALKGAGKSYEYVALDDEDHWLSKSETRLKMLEAAVAFIEKYNPPEDEAASSDSAVVGN